MLWPLRRPRDPPDKPPDIAPAGIGTWTSCPEPCFSFSSSLQECEELGEKKWEHVNNPLH